MRKNVEFVADKAAVALLGAPDHHRAHRILMIEAVQEGTNSLRVPYELSLDFRDGENSFFKQSANCTDRRRLDLDPCRHGLFHTFLGRRGYFELEIAQKTTDSGKQLGNLWDFEF